MNVTDNVIDANELLEVTVNDYVCCQYEDKFYIGLVKQFSDEHGDFLIQFMTSNVPIQPILLARC